MPVAVVTRRSPGDGRGIPTRLVRDGRCVWCLDVDARRVEGTAAHLCGDCGDAHTLPFDVGDSTAVLATWRHLDDHDVRVTALVNHAGDLPSRSRAGREALVRPGFRGVD